jgi:hypothetical protein
VCAGAVFIVGKPFQFQSGAIKRTNAIIAEYTFFKCNYSARLRAG